VNQSSIKDQPGIGAAGLVLFFGPQNFRKKHKWETKQNF
jgi:hypothetical protein